MNTKLRYISAWLLGICITIFTWNFITLALPIFMQFSISALIAPIIASILGGLVVAIFSPRHKVIMSAAVGFAISLPLLLFLLRNGLSHFDRNPFFWYWPVYVMPFFCVGGYLGRSIWRHQA